MSPRRSLSTTSPQRIDIKEAWAGDPPTPGGARERLLDATNRCIVRDGLAATGVASVAAEAGVSRPTVYRYFADRHALVHDALLRAGRAHAEATALHIRRFASAPHKAVEAELFVLGLVPSDPLLSEVWSSATLDATLLRDFTSAGTFALAREAVAEIVTLAGWDEREAEESIETMLRMLVSLLVAPEPERSERELRGFLERRLVPALGLAKPSFGPERQRRPRNEERPNPRKRG
jgi:AcrR family transcriptional regulator